MGKIELIQRIAAPPRQVFAFFVPQRMPYWYGAEMQSCFEVQDGAPDFALGLKVRVSGRIAGRALSHTAVVTGFEPARVLEWRFHDAHGVRGLERWQFETVALGAAPATETAASTLVRFVSEYEMPGQFGRWLDALFTRRAVTRRSREHLRRLADLVERKAAPERSWSVAR